MIHGRRETVVKAYARVPFMAIPVTEHANRDIDHSRWTARLKGRDIVSSKLNKRELATIYTDPAQEAHARFDPRQAVKLPLHLYLSQFSPVNG